MTSACRAVLLALCLLAAGCGSDAGQDAAPTPVPVPSTTTAPTTAPAPDPTPSAPGTVVVLQGDGLGVASGARITQLAFGSDRGTVITALAASLGSSAEEPAPDCGQGPRTEVQFDGFSVLLDGDAFVGWTEQGSAERNLTTADGIGLQATLSEVREALGEVSVDSDTLGPEFGSASGLSGLLDGTTPQSRVTLLSGGETCTSR